jgi:hypothetical protein
MPIGGVQKPYMANPPARGVTLQRCGTALNGPAAVRISTAPASYALNPHPLPWWWRADCQLIVRSAAN